MRLAVTAALFVGVAAGQAVERPAPTDPCRFASTRAAGPTRVSGP